MAFDRSVLFVSFVIVQFREVLPPIIDPGLDLFFHSLLGGFVKPANRPEVILRHKMPRKIVRVFVPLTVAEFVCAGIVGVLEMTRDGNCFSRSNLV